MVGFPIAALVGAAGSVLGGILGKPKPPKERTPREQILSTVQGAREAGIHPLAALGSGAGYSYSQDVGSGSAGTAVGAGIQKLAEGLAMQKSEEEIKALQADTDARTAQAELYRAQSRTLQSRISSRAIGGPPVSDQMPPEITMFGGKLRRDPNAFSSAQRVQDEYGDIMENVVGIPSFGWSVIRAMDERNQRRQQKFFDYTRSRSAPLDWGPQP